MSGLPDWTPRGAGSWERVEGTRPPAPRPEASPSSNPVVDVLGTGLIPAGRDLGSGELIVLLGAVAEQPSLWQSLAELERSSADQALLFRDQHLEVLVIRWTGEESESGWHDHDRSAAAVRVVLGALYEQPLGDDEGEMDVRIGPGTAYPFEPDHVHRLDPEVGGTLSLHAWSPPLRQTGLYDVDDTGRVRRIVVDL